MNKENFYKKFISLTRFALGLFFLFSLLLFSFVGIFYVSLFTDKGRTIISELMIKAIHDDNFQITLGPVTGSPPTPLKFSYIDIKDPKGVWARIENVDFIWNPSSLFRGKIDIEALNIEKINLLRLPTDSPQVSPDFKFELPRLPFSFALQKIKCVSITLENEVIGEKLELSLDGNVSYGFLSPKIALNLNVHESNGFEADLNLAYNQLHKNLSLLVHLFDKGHGFLAQKINMSLPTNIAFNGSGPIDHWKGELVANLGQKTVFLGDLSLQPVGKYLNGLLTVKTNFYDELKPFWAKSLEEECQAIVNFDIETSSIKLKEVRLKSPVFDFSFIGNTHILASSLSGDGKANMTFKKPFSFFSLNNVPYPVKTTSNVDCRLKGNWQDLDINIDGETKLDAIVLPGFGLTKDIALGVQTELHLKDFLTANIEVDIDTDIDFLGFNSQNKLFIDPQKLILKMEGRYKEQGETFSITTLNIQGDHLIFQGALDFTQDHLDSCMIDIQHQDLSRFESMVVPVQGTFNGSISKEKENSFFHLMAQSNDMCIKEYKLPEIMSEINVDLNGQQTKGDFLLNLGIEKPFNVSTQFDYGNNVLKLQNIVLGGTESKLLGQLSWDILKNNMQGSLKGNLREIDFLEPLLKVESLVGNVDCDFSFDNDKKGNTSLKGLIKAKDIHADERTAFDLGHGLIRLNMDDIFKKPKGSLNVSLLDCRMFDVDLSQGRFQLEGDFENARLISKLKGTKPFVYDAELVGNINKEKDNTIIQLSKLEGILNKTSYALTKPFILTHNKDSFSCPPTSLRIGKGVLAGFLNVNLLDNAKENSKLQFSWHDLPADLLTLIAPSLPLQGGIKGHITLEKNQKLTFGHFDIESNQLLFELGEDITPVFYTKLSGKINDNVLHLDGVIREEKVKDSDFTLKGKIPLLFHQVFLPSYDEKLPINVDCAGKLNLAYLSPFLPTYEDVVEGTIQGSLKLAGLLSDPNATGKISLEKGYYENAQFGTILNNIRCDIVAKNNELHLNHLSAFDQKKGEIKGKGSLSLKDNFPYNFNVVFNDYQLVNNDDADIKAFANLVFSGQKGQKNNLTGQVDINRAKVKIPEKTQQAEDDFFEEEENYCTENKPQFTSLVGLDLKVNFTNPLYLSGFGLDSEWLGNCRVQGDITKPRIKGTLKVQKGTFSLFGTSFDLKKGNVYFDGSDKLVPELYILTQAKTADLVANLNITGPVNAPKIDLTSSPEYPQEEIVSRLLFKHGTASLSPMQAIKLGTALSKMNGTKLPIFQQLDKIQNALGLDTFEFDTNDDENGTNPVFKVGGKITDKIKLGVEEDLKNTKTHGKLQVELTPHINLETGVNSDLQGNVGVFGKWDY